MYVNFTKGEINKMKCQRCKHPITKEDIQIGVATKTEHKIILCRTLDRYYGKRRNWNE